MSGCFDNGDTKAKLFGSPGVLFATAGSRAEVEVVVVVNIVGIDFVGADADDGTLIKWAAEY